MVFQLEAQFEQCLHCKFRENIVRCLCIPSMSLSFQGSVFLIVNKFGKVGLYEPKRFTLVHTYLLDMSSPVQPKTRVGHNVTTLLPKCQRSHLVVDACYASDLKSVFYLTTKGNLQCFDIGEIERQRYGVDIIPGKTIKQLKSGESPSDFKGLFHVETHRLYGLPVFPTCMEYSEHSASASSTEKGDDDNEKCSRLLIGCSDGFVIVIKIRDVKNVFGYRKIRGVVHQIKIQDLIETGSITMYKAHNGPITELRFFSQRQLIASSSKDKKYSIHVKDSKEILDPTVISLQKGVNCFAHSEDLKLIATGSDDGVRLFNQYVPSVPQIELTGHKAPVVAVQFVKVSFASGPILLSFSLDVELKAWDPTTYVCVQSIYISFPTKSTILCNTPEFARRPILVHQPPPDVNDEKEKRGKDGFLLIFYCNSFAKLFLEKDSSIWPFDFDELAEEFQTLTTDYERKLKWRKSSLSQNPNRITLFTMKEMKKVEATLDSYTDEVMELKQRVDKQLGRPIRYKNSSLSLEIMKRSHKIKNDPEKFQFLSEGGAFRLLPVQDIQPITFYPTGNNLPVTATMKKRGLSTINNPEYLITSEAMEYFSPENMKMVKAETSLAKLDHFPNTNQSKNISTSEIDETTIDDNKVVQEKYESMNLNSEFNKSNNIDETENFLLKSLESLMEFSTGDNLS